MAGGACRMGIRHSMTHSRPLRSHLPPHPLRPMNQDPHHLSRYSRPSKATKPHTALISTRIGSLDPRPTYPNRTDYRVQRHCTAIRGEQPHRNAPTWRHHHDLQALFYSPGASDTRARTMARHGTGVPSRRTPDRPPYRNARCPEPVMKIRLSGRTCS